MPKISTSGSRGSSVESGFRGFRVAVRPVWYARMAWWLRILPMKIDVNQISRKGLCGKMRVPVGEVLSHNVDRLLFARDDDSRWFRLEKFYITGNGEGRMEC